MTQSLQMASKGDQSPKALIMRQIHMQKDWIMDPMPGLKQGQLYIFTQRVLLCCCDCITQGIQWNLAHWEEPVRTKESMLDTSTLVTGRREKVYKQAIRSHGWSHRHSEDARLLKSFLDFQKTFRNFRSFPQCHRFLLYTKNSFHFIVSWKNKNNSKQEILRTISPLISLYVLIL